MKEREYNTAKRFGVLERMEELESALLNIDHVVSVDFDIDGFWDNIRQVILVPEYDVPVSLPNYYEVRRVMLNRIINVAHQFGLWQSGDTIEDYGKHFYIVRNCDNSWELRGEAN